MDNTLIDQAEKQAALCRVLGNCRRLQIIWLLSDGELPVNEIAAQIGSTMQNISQHLTLLRKTGIVTARREGQTRYYRIAEPESAWSCPALIKPSDPKIK